jgi:hypothetical protein
LAEDLIALFVKDMLIRPFIGAAPVVFFDSLCLADILKRKFPESRARFFFLACLIGILRHFDDGLPEDVRRKPRLLIIPLLNSPLRGVKLNKHGEKIMAENSF